MIEGKGLQPGIAMSLGIAFLVMVGCAEQPTITPTGAKTAEQPSILQPSLALCDPEAPPPAQAPGQVFVYFSCGAPAVAAVAPVVRQSDARSAEGQLTDALRALLAGPNPAEVRAGLRSWFSANTADAIHGVTLDDAGLAIIDFIDFSGTIPNASTAAGQQQLLAEIRATAFQFDEVELVRLQFDGSCERFWGWLQAACMPLAVEGA